MTIINWKEYGKNEGKCWKKEKKKVLLFILSFIILHDIKRLSNVKSTVHHSGGFIKKLFEICWCKNFLFFFLWNLYTFQLY